MTITLQEPYNTWIKTHVGTEANENTKFSITIGSTTPTGSVDVKLDVDLIWFIVLYVDDAQNLKLDVVRELLKFPEVLPRFKATLAIVEAKRVIEEYLIFNFDYLNLLKGFIDFNLLNIPIDFISHALFIKRSFGADTVEINMDRIKTISAVLDTGYKLPTSVLPNAQGAVLRKVLMMDDIESKFKVARRLLEAGYNLFGPNFVDDAETAIMLINARNDSDAQAIIQQNAALFKNIRMDVAGNASNLADFYYWVKEDMDALRYVKETLGIDLSPTT